MKQREKGGGWERQAGGGKEEEKEKHDVGMCQVTLI